MINPFMLMAAKTKLLPDEVVDIDVRNMLWLDMLKSKKADDGICGQITRNLVLAQVIAADKQSRALYDISCDGIRAFMKAMIRKEERNADVVDLSTDEFKAVKKVLLSYSKILPQLDVGTISGAADRWLEIKAHYKGMTA
ncbi:hypothetical protein phiPLPE_72 [Iodobacter phage PhiPLPE]|uniref:Uncharacterized protein n=1 Tax=Iodobacter phage PhiPLPE TaxID=551895 RepID=B5AX91_9CAUD|nr:hypothetical protein phiPLPE_72 [Iodobacter phage PhiPLPE]ACG60394.1 hypothetical protein phiPLPE_72 [Iodobacter phage PhiPLPE]